MPEPDPIDIRADIGVQQDGDPFCFRDAVTRKWLKARYVAERHEFEARYREWEIVREQEYRQPVGKSFNPWQSAEQ